MTTRICGCPTDGPRLRMGVGAKMGTCSCCKMTGGVVDLPVCEDPADRTKLGSRALRDVATPFCGSCLNPNYKAPSYVPSERNIKHGTRWMAVDEIPASLRFLLHCDTTQTPNKAPSAQRQKAASRASEDDE